jgi:hypothetical protein
MDPNGCELHARINGGAHGSPERIPDFVVKPMKKVVGAIGSQILQCIEKKKKQWAVTSK